MEQLVRLRELKGFSQRALAKESGVSPATIYELENGRRRPNPTTLRKLAGALNVEVADLLGTEYPKEGRRSSPEPTLFNGLEEERRPPPLQSWTALVSRVADRWEKEIAEREQEWQGAEPAVRSHVKRLPNFNWAVEISKTANDIVDVASEQMELALGVATSSEALELFRAFKRLDKVIEQTRSWFDVDARDAPGLAQVYDFQEALKRMEKKIGARAS
jgi:transcriptional regulator with XRE-family HTH domain